MNKAILTTIGGLVLLIGIVVLNINDTSIEQVNEDLAVNPPAAGRGVIYKVTIDGITSYTDVRPSKLGNAKISGSGGLKSTSKDKKTKTETTASFEGANTTIATADTSVQDSTTTSTPTTTTDSSSLTRSEDTNNTTTAVSEEPVVEVIQVATLIPQTSTSAIDIYNGLALNHSQWESQFAMLPQDQDGWSVIKPAEDSRFIYVSSSEGDDTKARAYTINEVFQPRTPTSTIIAFKTLSNALKLQRAGYSDWVLLKKGDQWQLDKALSLPSGRSNVAPLVITSYGDLTQRPLMKTGVQTGIKLVGHRSFIALIGIEFYANQRNPESADFIGWSMIVDAPSGFISVANNSEEVKSITLEDNVFRFFANNITFTGSSKQKNIVVRRNQSLNSYSTTSHAQGIYAGNTSMLLEENLFDHNGWYQQNYEKLNSKAKGQATYFNHNAYLTNMFDTVIIDNIFSHASSMGIKLTANPGKVQKINHVMAKNIVIDNNLIIEGELGISAGGNTDFNNGYRWQNMTITNNVLLNIGKSQPTRRNLAWYIEANDWDGGIISGNHLLCNNNPNVTNIIGIYVTGLSRNVSVLENILFGLKGHEDRMLATSTKENQTAILFKNNLVSKDALCETLLFSNESSIAPFISGAKKQSSANWNSKYTAAKFNEKVKSVFAK